jgi:hypothetical protein
MLPADELLSVLAEIPLASRAEVTVECNPDDITLEMMQQYLRGGVNRVSIGVQSTVDHVLQSLGRTHNPENVQRAVAHVKQAGFLTFNLDIMYGAGISKLGEIIDLGVKAGIVEKSGSWFSYDSQRIGQGRENVRAFLKANPDIADSIEKAVRASTSKIAEELLGTPEPDEGQDLEG